MIESKLCNNKSCLKKHTCYKFSVIPSKGWQKRVNFDREQGALCYKHDYELSSHESK